jgi:hypothetical protein
VLTPGCRTPVNALWFDLSINALLGLLMFASPVAIGAVFSIGAIAQYIAFTIPIALRLTAAANKFRPGELSKCYSSVSCSSWLTSRKDHGT